MDYLDYFVKVPKGSTFAWDMLRYDNATIVDSIPTYPRLIKWKTEEYDIIVKVRGSKCTKERWKSFGNIVVE